MAVKSRFSAPKVDPKRWTAPHVFVACGSPVGRGYRDDLTRSPQPGLSPLVASKHEAAEADEGPNGGADVLQARAARGRGGRKAEGQLLLA